MEQWPNGGPSHQAEIPEAPNVRTGQLPPPQAAGAASSLTSVIGSEQGNLQLPGTATPRQLAEGESIPLGAISRPTRSQELHAPLQRARRCLVREAVGTGSRGPSAR